MARIVIHVRGANRLDADAFSSEQLMRDIGELAIRKIRTRTERRVDLNGQPFRPLSPAYAKRKAEAGLPPLADLQVSGDMLNAMVVDDVTKNTVHIGFAGQGALAPPRTGRRRSNRGTASPQTFIQQSRSVGPADKAYYHNEAGVGNARIVREFFGLSEEDEDDVVALIDRYFDELLGS